MNNLVSVIVTSYNHAEYLPQRLDSILSQTYENIEIIIIDDCSTDNSREVYKNYIRHHHIKVEILKENKGYANASNLGVSLSQGNFIMFAEADDYDDPTHIEVLVNNIIKDNKIGVVFCRNNIIDENGTIICDGYQTLEQSLKKYCSKNTLISGFLMQRFLLRSCVIPNMSAALIKKHYFKLSGGFSPRYKMSADWDFWCRISRLCDFYYVSAPLNNFRTHMTTLRSTIEVKTQISELFNILYTAASQANLSVLEKINFRLNMGYLCIFLIATNINKIRNLISSITETAKYEKFAILFLFWGTLRYVYLRIYWKFSKLFKLFRI